MAVAQAVFDRRCHPSDNSGLQCVGDRRDRNAQIARTLAVHFDAKLGLRFLQARLHVGDARNPAHRRHELSRDPIELVDFRTAHADLDRLLTKGARLGQPERQTRHALHGLARSAQHLAEGSAFGFLQFDERRPFGDRPELCARFADRRVGVIDVGKCAKARDHLLRPIACLAQRRTRRGLEGHLILPAIEVRHEVAAEHGQYREGPDEGDQSDPGRRPPMAQRPIESTLVRGMQIVKPLVEPPQAAPDEAAPP